MQGPSGDISPLRLLWLLVLAIFVAESLVMTVLLGAREELSPLWQVLIDSSALLLITSPLLYRFFYRPLRQQLNARRAAEESLRQVLKQTRESRDRMDILLKSLAEGLIATDGDDRVVLINPAAEAWLGLSADDVLGVGLGELPLHEKLLSGLRAGCDCRDQPHQIDVDVGTSSVGAEQLQTLRFRCTPLPGHQDRIPGRITIFYDVTHEAEVDRLKSEFISLAAHELRTPLTAVLGYADILCRYKDLSPEDRDEFVEQIRDGGLNLSRIIDELLDVARIEAGRGLELECRELIAEELFLQMDLARYVSGSGHSFELQLDDPTARLNADPYKIRQVLINLLSNAFKYSPEAVRVTLAGQISDGHYRISVSDQGIGMTPDQVERVFEKFYRADPGNRAVKGIGLGMYIVKHIVEAHHGRIWIESQWGQGTMVCLSLPLQLPADLPAE